MSGLKSIGSKRLGLCFNSILLIYYATSSLLIAAHPTAINNQLTTVHQSAVSTQSYGSVSLQEVAESKALWRAWNHPVFGLTPGGRDYYFKSITKFYLGFRITCK